MTNKTPEAIAERHTAALVLLEKRALIYAKLHRLLDEEQKTVGVDVVEPIRQHLKLRSHAIARNIERSRGIQKRAQV